METKVIRMYLKTYRKLRRQIKPRVNETLADYMDRVLERTKWDYITCNR